MKTKSLLAASLVLALGIGGCSNSLDEESQGVKENDNILIVNLPDNVKKSRGVEESVDGHETTVDDVTVFLLNGPSVESVVEFNENDLQQNYKRIENVASSVNRVLVVANRIGEDIMNLRTVNEIKNYGFSVESQHKKTELKGKTLMGEADVREEGVNDPNPDGHKYKEANVDLRAITARIEVGTVAAGEGVESVELVAVYINNFYAKYPQQGLTTYDEDDANWSYTLQFPEQLPNIGLSTPIGTITPGAYDPDAYKIEASDDVKLEDITKVYAFHVFPGNIPHLVMLVKVVLEENYYETQEDGTPLKYKFGYLTFTKFNIGSGNYLDAMEGHNVYRMGVGKNGIPVNAKDITDKPEKGPYDLGVKIDIRPWDIHEVTPEV